MMLETIITIIVECMPTMVRYWPGENTGGSGRSSSVRISIAFRPPIRKKTAIPNRYCTPITLWSVDMRR